MKKSEFIIKLRTKLDIFTNEEQEKIINYYTTFIENSENQEETINSLGSIEEIQDKIFLIHGINPKKVKKQGLFKRLEELFQVVHQVVEIMSNNKMKENAKIFLDLLVLIFFICLIKIPFIFIRNIGESLLDPFGVPILLTIWSVILDIIYIVVAFMVFVNIFTKWFKNLTEKKKEKVIEEKKEEKKIIGSSLEAISLEEMQKEQEKEKRED